MPVHEERNGARREEGEVSVTVEATQSAWKTIWQNNKGMFLILLAEVAASSMVSLISKIWMVNTLGINLGS